jgi:thioredoxin reductase
MDEIDVIIVGAGPKGYVHAGGCVDGGLLLGALISGRTSTNVEMFDPVPADALAAPTCL